MKPAILQIRTHARLWVLGILICISIVLWSVVVHENRHGILTFTVLNIGQGDALFIESPTGTQVVIDGGPGNALMREISAVMPWYDKHIDMIVVTNPDLDHYEGFLSLLDSYSVDSFLESGTNSTTETYALLRQKITDKKIPRIVGKRGQVIDIGGGAYIQVLFPDRDATNMSSNDGSLVARLIYGDTSVMLQGDSTDNIEHYLVQLDGDKLKSTILKAGHHGSRTSSSEEYVEEVSPAWTVMSSGIDNSYGHPHKETLATLEKLKIPALDTCAMGRIVFHSDGKEFKLDTKMKEVTVGCK